MPPFFERAQLDEALQNQVIPLLEALAKNDNLHNRSLRRFERDDPPPYVSSTESEEFDDDFFAPLSPIPLNGELPEEVKAIMEQPISDDELKRITFGMRPILEPVDFYLIEAKREERRVHHLRWNEIFRGVKSFQQHGILVRHCVKHRWEKLGV